MSLSVYPTRQESGSENMATDWWLLQNASNHEMPSLRHYLWNKHEISFGYGQNWEWVEKETGITIEKLIRRPTGGGIVRHGRDWTYCLVLPRKHNSFSMPSLDLYEGIHQVMGMALDAVGLEAFLQPCPLIKKASIPGDCFEEPVGKDLMAGDPPTKIAGAAMKKTREAILMQGTMSLLPEWSPEFKSKEFFQKFTFHLSEFLNEEEKRMEWPNKFLIERKKWVIDFENLNWKKYRERI